MKKLTISFLTLLLSVVLTCAQSTTGRLSGNISGPDGLLTNATVKVTDNKTAKEFTATSNEEGSFLFPQLEFGTYTVEISVPGFKTFIANDVKIDVGRDYTLNPVLEVGNVQESVTVTAGADIVTATTAQVSNTVSQQQILSLPLITRDPLNLITLQAGTADNPFQGTSINGLRTTFTNTTRDGINIQDNFIRTNATDFAPGRPSVDDTGEFTITTSNQEADQGYGGAQIRLVTPRGTKDFSGALFAFNRNSAFAANNFFNNRNGTPIPFRNRNQFGGKLGGPLPLPSFGEGGPVVLRDKGFFFFAYEGIRDPLATRATRTILTPSARTGVFTYNRTIAGSPINTTVGGATVNCPSGAVGSACTISNIQAFALGRGFAGIGSGINPVIQSRILDNLPAASNFTGGDGLNTTGFAVNRQSNQTRDTFTTRIDVDATEKDSFNGVFSYNDELNLRPDVDETGFAVTPDGVQTSTNKTLALAYRRIFSSNIVNEVRGGLFTSEVPFNRLSAIPSFLLTLPLISNPENNFQPQGRQAQTYNLQDNLDYALGEHSLKFGVQFQRFVVDSYGSGGITPTLTVGETNVSTGTSTAFVTGNFADIGGINTTQLGTASSLLALLNGSVNAASQTFNIQSIDEGFTASPLLQPFRFSNYSAYGSDRWQIARGLTVSYGLRYEIFQALKLASGIALQPVLDENDVVGSLRNRAGTYAPIGTNSGVENTFYKTDYNNFAPTVGIAYTPNFESGIGKFLLGREGRTVLRAGYSHIYGNDSIITSTSNATTINVGFGSTGSNAIGPAATAALNDRLGGQLTAINAPVLAGTTRTFLQNNSAAIASNFGTAFAIDPNLQTPMVRQYSAGIQREFAGNMALEIRYVGNSSNNLTRGVDFNQIDIFNNGFLADFNRASSNLALTGNAFCTPPANGCQALTIFQNGGTGSPGRLAVGGVVTAAQFNNDLRTGVPADLALRFIQGGINNQPTVANPNATPFVNFLANPATGVTNVLLNGGSSYYNSLQIELRRRFSQGLYFQANYTFAKNLTNAIGTSQALFEPFLDINNQDLEYQRADFDVTHAFNFNGVYQLPFGRGRAFLNQGGIVDKIFGGFELSGLVQISSGAPITFIDTRGTLNRGGRSGRQTPFSNLTNDEIRDLVGIFEANGRIYYLNPSVINAQGQASQGFLGQTGLNTNATFDGQAFFNVAPGQTGNLGRALINGPRFVNINAALLKNINFTERVRVQLRAEAFNLFNTVNFFNNTQFANINSTDRKSVV